MIVGPRGADKSRHGKKSTDRRALMAYGEAGGGHETPPQGEAGREVEMPPQEDEGELDTLRKSEQKVDAPPKGSPNKGKRGCGCSAL